MTKEEACIQKPDESTGASLKLTVLNAEGRVWTVVAGGSTKLCFVDSEPPPYIITPLHSNIPVQGTSASYSFQLEDGAVGGVANSGVDAWLYARKSEQHVLIERYAGQLIVTWLV